VPILSGANLSGPFKPCFRKNVLRVVVGVIEQNGVIEPKQKRRNALLEEAFDKVWQQSSVLRMRVRKIEGDDNFTVSLKLHLQGKRPHRK